MCFKLQAVASAREKISFCSCYFNSALFIWVLASIVFTRSWSLCIIIIKERAWMLLLQGTVAEEAKMKKYMEDERALQEQDWVDCQLGDEDLSLWADWDVLEYNLAKDKKTGTMLDWLTKESPKEIVTNMEVDVEFQEEMEIDDNIPEMERERRLWKVSLLKLEWSERGA
jgi:hypothetical protein